MFGNTGMYVAKSPPFSNAKVRVYNAALIENGLVSTESAEKAREVTDAMDCVKQQLQAASTELMVALLPLILELIDIAKVTIIPILNTIAGWFAKMSPAQLNFVFLILMLIILLPKVIAIITAIIGVVKAITIASYGATGGLGAVAAAILIDVLLFVMLAGKSNDAKSELNKQQKQKAASFESR